MKKKSLRIISIMLILAMVLPMIPISIFAQEPISEETPQQETVDLAALGQDTYYTGKNYKFTPTMDGTIDSGYVCVTPNGADTVFTNRALENVASGTEVLAVDKNTFTESQKAYADSIVTKYYVAQDDNYVYLVVKQDMSAEAYVCADENTYQPWGNVFSSLKLGFNADDYTQQISLYSHGKYVTESGSSATVKGITYQGTWKRYPFIVQGIAQKDKFNTKAGAESPIVAEPVDESGIAKDSILVRPGTQTTGTFERTYELKLSKSGITSEYQTLFGVTPDFSTMYIGMSSYDYSWANSKSNYSTFWMTGTVIDSATASENDLTTYIPDVVKFGTKPVEESMYNELGRDTYYTGKDYTYTPTLDGKVDTGYTCLTPGGADVITTNTNFYSKKTSGMRISVADKSTFTDVHKAFADSISAKFYMAQDDENVYVAVEHTTSSSSYTVNDVTYTPGSSGNILTNLRLGFNPDNYKQQIDLYSDGQYAVTESSGAAATKTINGITYNGKYIRYPFIVQGLTDESTYTSKAGTASSIIANYVNESGAALDSTSTASTPATGYITRTYELKLNKAAIAAEYKAVFGEETEVSFDSMFIGLSARDYKWANSTSNYATFWTTGSVISVDAETQRIYGLTDYIPDKVVFGYLCPGPAAEHTVSNCTNKVVATQKGNCVTDDFVQRQCDCGKLFYETFTKADGHNYSGDSKTCLDCGSTTYTVNDYKSATSDATISSGEYSVTADLAISGYSGSKTFSTLRTTPPSSDEQGYVSESMSMSFSHDASKIYIGVLDKSGTSTVRNGYMIRLGFDEAHPENIIGFYLQCANLTVNGSSKTDVHNALTTTASYAYSQAGYRGIARSNGSYNWWANTAANGSDDYTRMFYTSSTASTYPVTAMTIAREDVDGDAITLGSGHGRIGSGQHYTYYEIELDKALLLKFYNEMNFNSNNGGPIDDLSTMLFSIQQTETNSEKLNVMWGGAFDESKVASEAYDLAAYSWDRVIFNTPEINLDDFGQETYYTGGYHDQPSVNVNGKVDSTDGYVCVTPNGANTVLTNTTIGSKVSGTAMSVVTKNEAHGNFPESMSVNYYVAQDNDYIYLVVHQKMDKVTYTVNDITYDPSGNMMTYLRLGFNPADYREQIVLYSDGFWLTQSGTTEKNGISYGAWTEYPFIVQGLVDENKFTSKAGTATAIIETYTDENKKEVDSIMLLDRGSETTPIQRTYELKLNKAAIAAEYAAVFGSEVDFNSMFIGMTSSDYKWANSTSNASIHFTSGTIVDTQTAKTYGLTTFIPDSVKFGSLEVTEEVENQIGKDTYYTGKDFDSDTVTIDGFVKPEDGYINVTPNGAGVVVANTYLGKVSSRKELLAAQRRSEHNDFLSSLSTKYYVAQDDDYVYLAVEQRMPVKGYTVDDVTYDLTSQVFTYLRLGFNPNDYTQQIVLYSDGRFVSMGTDQTVGGATFKSQVIENGTTSSWVRYPFIVQGLADAYGYVSKTGTATDIIEDYVDNNDKIKDSILQRYTDSDGSFVRLYEMKLSKSAIAAEYATAFGADTVDFSAMFIGMSCYDYAWANNDENYSLFWGNGALTDTTTALKYGLANFVLDEIKFAALCPGVGVEHTVDNCHFTEIENVEVGCENDGYVKNRCDRCGAEFYSSYTEATGHTFDQQVISDETLYQAGDCANGTRNKYYYSCHCGEIEGDPNHIFEGDLLPHVWTSPEDPIEANVKTPADCHNKAVYYQVCSVCSKNAATAGEAERTYEVGEALGHNWVDKPGKPVTCIAVGWDPYKECSRCGEKEGFELKAPLRWAEGMSQAEVDKGDHTSLTQYGQKIYATGHNKFMATDGLMYLDGNLDAYEPYVDVTPNYVDKVGISGDYTYGMTDITATADPDPYSSDLKYYVAQDSENIYLLIEDYAPYVEQDGEAGLTRWDESILRNFYRIKIGFDTNNYERALYLRLNGGNFPENSASSLYIVSGDSYVNIKDNGSVNSVLETSFARYASTGSVMGTANDNYANQAGKTWNDQWVARLEIKIKKDLVDDAYALLNDSKPTNLDFSQMFVGVSTRTIRYGETTSTGDDNAYAAYTNYGAYVGSGAGLTSNYIPDVIVFGQDKNASLTTAHGCDLTAHRTDDRYLYNRIDNGDGTGTAWFYHSCANETEEGVVCSVVGATTFKTTYTTDGSGNKVYTVVYTEQAGVPDPKFAVNDDVVTCEDSGTYYMHCSCGVEDRKSGETYTIEALGHDWTDHDNDYKTPRYCSTCKTTDSSVYITQPTQGSVKNILMIGNSFCYYFVEELYDIAKTAGVELNVANLYVSGRSVSDHRAHIEGTNTTAYQFYLTDENGRNLVDGVTTIDGALAYAKANLGGDWDVISFQQHFSPAMAKRYDTSIDATLEDATFLFNYVKETGTDAKLYWQQTWAYQVGYNRSDGPISTKAEQTHTYRNIKKVAEEVAKANGVTLVPTGDAWQIMRNEYDYDGLCDKPYGQGDEYHDGDTGGGQYLNACVWFETVTGESCKGNTWRPDYKLNTNVAYLQEAAHKAVAQIYGPAYARHECAWAAATCTTPKMCLACGVTEGEALGHINAAGTVFTDACNVEVADRNCTRCGTYVKIVHKYDDNNICTVCGNERTGWIPPEDIGTYYATDVSTNKPTIDGVISVGEYGEKVTVNDPLSRYVNTTTWAESWATVPHDRTITSKYMDYYFAYDEEYIYIAINDVGNDGMSRSNYRFNFGFDLNDVTSYFQIDGYQTNGTSAWAKLQYYKGGTGWLPDSATSELICESMIRKVDVATGNTVAIGDLLAANGNANYTENNWKLIVEFKFSKADIIKCMNTMTGTNYAELSDAMWIALTTNSYRGDDAGLFRWLGRNDITGIQGNFADYVPDGVNFTREWMFDLIVFGDENTEILAANPDPCNGDNHTLIHHEAKVPTATEYGWNAYDECTVCNYTTYEPIRPYDCFKTGYQRVDITPDVPTGDFTSIANALYATCVAVNDGIDTVILISVDISSINETHTGDIRRKVAYATGVPEENVFVSATHTHSSRHFTSDDIWRFESFVAIANAAKAAIDDLEDTEIFIASTANEGAESLHNGLDNIAYVRRYIGTPNTLGNVLGKSTEYASVKPGSNTYHNWSLVDEDEDHTLQVVRMVRGGKDIVMTNWQAHLAHHKNEDATKLSSDIAHYMRYNIEKGDTDTQIIYLAGASGNINLTSASGTAKKVEEVGATLANTALQLINKDGPYIEKIESGKINVSVEEAYQAARGIVSQDVLDAAQARADAGEAIEGDNYLLSRSSEATYMSLRLGAVSFGELAFITAPYEMFDTNGLYIKNNSKFKMTLIITNAGADLAYMPSAEYYTSEFGYVGYDNKTTTEILSNPYETRSSYFGEGTAEDVADEFLTMLNELWELGKVVDIDITYTSMAFTYESGPWNPSTLSYDEGTWSAGENGGQIAVTNQGTVEVNITFAFNKADGYDFLTGSFSGAGLNANVVALPTKEQILVTFTLRGIPTEDLEDAPVGSITITIAEAAAAQGG